MIVQGPDLWERLCETTTPVVLYGTGNGADKILDELIRRGIPVSGIFASDGFVRKRTFRGFDVLSYSEAAQRFPDMTVLFCFGSSRPEVLQNIDSIAAKHPFFAPDVPVYGDNLFDRPFYERNREKLDRVRDMLADEQSVRVFDCTINYKLTGDIAYLRECETTGDTYDILQLPEGVSMLDLGAFTGDTVAEFVGKNPHYGRITAVEPEKRNYRKLKENTRNIPRVTTVRAAVSDVVGQTAMASHKGMGSHESDCGTEVPSVTVDYLVQGEEGAILIKADVEGNELKMLTGAVNTVTNKSPWMIIDCYHRSEDLFTLPEAVMKMNGGYRVYMRHRPYVPAWETMFFFVPVH